MGTPAHARETRPGVVHHEHPSQARIPPVGVVGRVPPADARRGRAQRHRHTKLPDGPPRLHRRRAARPVQFQLPIGFSRHTVRGGTPRGCVLPRGSAHGGGPVLDGIPRVQDSRRPAVRGQGQPVDPAVRRHRRERGEDWKRGVPAGGCAHPGDGHGASLVRGCGTVHRDRRRQRTAPDAGALQGWHRADGEHGELLAHLARHGRGGRVGAGVPQLRLWIHRAGGVRALVRR